MWKTGDKLRIRYEGRTVDASVTMASPSGRSLLLEFDAILGPHAGAMPVLFQEDDEGMGVYRSVVTGTPLDLWKPVTC